MKLVYFLLLLFLLGFTRTNLTPFKFPELAHFPEMPRSEENPVTYEGVELGRYLFYDSILSIDYSMSCATCHQQKFAFTDIRQFSLGRNGIETRRNSMPLFNLAWYPALFWDGRATNIEEQIFHPVRDENEMALDWKTARSRIKDNQFYKEKFKHVFGEEEIDSTHISQAIGQFLRSLISNQSKYDRVINGEDYFTEDESKGFELMNDMTMGDCLHCHTTDANGLGTTAKFSNNGLDSIYDAIKYKDKGLGEVTGNIQDNGKFKIPSLRNLVFTAPYMHDGRFETLKEVLDFYSEGVHTSANVDSKMGLAHQGGVHLSEKEKSQIISFLKTLSDSSFIKNKEYSNPFTL